MNKSIREKWAEEIKTAQRRVDRAKASDGQWTVPEALNILFAVLAHMDTVFEPEEISEILMDVSPEDRPVIKST